MDSVGGKALSNCVKGLFIATIALCTSSSAISISDFRLQIWTMKVFSKQIHL